MGMTDNIRKDIFLLIDGQIVLVTDRRYKTQGRQGGLIIFSAKNVETGQVVEHTVKAGTKFEEIATEYRELQYIYRDGDQLVFMDTKSFDNISLSVSLVGEYTQYMKEGDKYVVMFFEDKALSLRKNPTVELKIKESVDAVKGDTANSATKVVTTETGYKVKVPLFVKQGDTITVNTETGNYAGRI